MSQQQVVTAPIGIDIGTLNSKIAVAKRGGVEVIANEANFRETPCIVGYGPSERQLGQAGNIKIKSNFKDTVTFPSRFLGLQSDYPFLRVEKKFCPAKCVNKDNNKIAFEVKYQGQPETLSPQQVFAAYLNKLKLIVNKNNFDNKTAVIAVPTYLTQQERKAVLDAAKIAELGVTRLLNESTAVALDYGIFRKNELDATNPRNVLFIDFGHSKLSTFLCSFTNSEMNVLEQQHCRHLGCRDIDYHLLQFYRGIFEKSSGGCDLTENRKAVIKIMESIQRQRRILTGNQEQELNIECLMEDNDIRYNMKREQFQKISEPIFNAIGEVMKKMKDIISQKKLNLHSIELIGGGSRIPGFINIIKQMFGVEPSRTLSSSESVARGCALMAAIKSPLFRVADYNLNEKAYYGVKFFWNFVEGEKFLGLDSSRYPQKQGKFIYESGAKVPTSKTVKFARKEAIQVLIEYQPVINGFNKHIGYFVTKPQHPKEQTFGVSFKIKFNQNGLVTFEDCSLVEEWFEETKVPKKKQEKKKEEPKKDEAKKDEAKKEGDQPVPQPEKMDVEQEFDIKKVKKQKYSQVKFESNTFDALSAKDIETYFTIESTMLNQDRIIIETYERKNELESLTYTWKEKITGSHKDFAKSEQVPEILNYLAQQKEWLYNDGENASRGVYNQRIAAIKSKVGAVAKRYDSFQATLDELHQLDGCLMSNSEKLNSLDKKYEHIAPEQRQQGFNMISNVRQWVLDADAKQKQIPKYQTPAITAPQIKEKSKELNEKIKKIMSKAPPPPPPKQEKKQNPKKQDPKKEDPKAQKMQPESNPAGPAPQKMQTE